MYFCWVGVFLVCFPLDEEIYHWFLLSPVWLAMKNVSLSFLTLVHSSILVWRCGSRCQQYFWSGPIGSPDIGMVLILICPIWPLLLFMCIILYAAGLPWWLNCCWGKELFLGMLPEGQPFISEDWYIVADWGCCSIGFWEGPILDDTIGLGGLDTLLNAGSGCWLIP